MAKTFSGAVEKEAKRVLPKWDGASEHGKFVVTVVHNVDYPCGCPKTTHLSGADFVERPREKGVCVHESGLLICERCGGELGRITVAEPGYVTVGEEESSWAADDVRGRLGHF